MNDINCIFLADFQNSFYGYCFHSYVVGWRNLEMSLSSKKADEMAALVLGIEVHPGTPQLTFKRKAVHFAVGVALLTPILSNIILYVCRLWRLSESKTYALEQLLNHLPSAERDDLRNKLFENGRLKGNEQEIATHLKAAIDYSTLTTNPALLQAMQRLLKLFPTILGETEIYKLKLNDNTEEFCVHRNLLAAQSDVFTRVLFPESGHTFRETELYTLREDISVQTLRQFAQFIEEGPETTLDDANLMELYDLAERYEVKKLSDQCRLLLKRVIKTTKDSRLFARFWEFAMKSGYPILLTLCWEYGRDRDGNFINAVQSHVTDVPFPLGNKKYRSAVFLGEEQAIICSSELTLEEIEEVMAAIPRTDWLFQGKWSDKKFAEFLKQHKTIESGQQFTFRYLTELQWRLKFFGFRQDPHSILQEEYGRQINPLLELNNYLYLRNSQYSAEDCAAVWTYAQTLQDKDLLFLCHDLAQKTAKTQFESLPGFVALDPESYRLECDHNRNHKFFVNFSRVAEGDLNELNEKIDYFQLDSLTVLHREDWDWAAFKRWFKGTSKITSLKLSAYLKITDDTYKHVVDLFHENKALSNITFVCKKHALELIQAALNKEGYLVQSENLRKFDRAEGKINWLETSFYEVSISRPISFLKVPLQDLISLITERSVASS